MESILELLVWLAAILAIIGLIVFLGGLLLWFPVRRVTGEPCSYRRCCVANALSAAIQTMFALFLWLVLPNPSKAEALVAIDIQLVVAWCIHMRVLCKWFSVTAGQAFLITLYHASLGFGLAAATAVLWYIALMVTGN